MDHNNILGTVLAGGKSQRFGEDKSQVKLGDKLLIDYILSEIIDEFNEVLVVSNNLINFKYSKKISLIKDMGYQCKSCVYCQASVSLLSRKIKNKKINEIKTFVTNGEKLFEDVKITMEKHWKDFKVILDKKNLARKECLLLPLRTILKALKI